MSQFSILNYAPPPPRTLEIHLRPWNLIGSPITSNDILNNTKWSGKSKLGEILMFVRSDIE